MSNRDPYSDIHLYSTDARRFGAGREANEQTGPAFDSTWFEEVRGAAATFGPGSESGQVARERPAHFVQNEGRIARGPGSPMRSRTGV
jgi:hypothetical protein